MAENISISLLPVQGGDCIHIRFLDEPGKYRNILIDGGLNAGYRNALKKQLEQVKANNEDIDLLVVTHIDDDHIGGILAWLKKRSEGKEANEGDITLPINYIWFNSGDMIGGNNFNPASLSRTVELVDDEGEPSKSVRQGITLEEYVQKNLETHKVPISAPQVHQVGKCKLTILSPTAKQLEKLDKLWETEEAKRQKVKALTAKKELRQQKSIPDSLLSPYEPDDSRPNGSSIAFLLEIGSFRAIFSGDAPSESILESLQKLGYGPKNPLRLNLFKVSHHGSQNNTSSALLSNIQCDLYCFSTDGIKHGHPDIESIARILTSPTREPGKRIRLAFNYPNLASLKMIQPSDPKTYNFEMEFPKEVDAPLEFRF